jgi:ankyrin repeat protein
MPSEGGSVSVVREVMKKARNVNHLGNDGMTALDHAERNGMEEIARLLREALAKD